MMRSEPVIAGEIRYLALYQPEAEGGYSGTERDVGELPTHFSTLVKLANQQRQLIPEAPISRERRDAVVPKYSGSRCSLASL